MKGLRIAGLAVAGVAALTVMTAREASAQEEGVLMKDLLGKMGIIPEERPPIDYRERPPLVVPPNLELRPPADPEAVQSRAANWPNDPDVAAERKRRAEASVPRTETDLYKRNSNQDRLTGEQIRAGRIAGRALPDETPPRKGLARDDGWVHPDELRAAGQTQRRATAATPGARRALTEPPTALRGPAPGAAGDATPEAVQREDDASPWSFIRQQSAR
jgi:hypothetical protein